MDILARGRNGGKTTEIVKRFMARFRQNQGRVFLVVVDEKEKRRVCRLYELPMKYVLSFREFEFQRGDLMRCEIFIDNIDLWLEGHFGSRLKMVTLTA
jgi:hypothetical protein